MPEIHTIPQLVSAPLNPILIIIAEQSMSHPQCEGAQILGRVRQTTHPHLW